MRNKILKKLMVFGLVCSMSLTMMPTAVLASGNQTESETKRQEETKEPQSEDKQTEKSQPETKTAASVQEETKGPEKPQAETKHAEMPENETKQSETHQDPKKQSETQGAVEQLLDQPGVTGKSAADGLLTVEGGTPGTDYTYDEGTGVLVVLSEKELEITGEPGTEYEGRIEIQADKAKVTLSDVNLLNAEGAVLVVKEGKSLDLTLVKENSLIARRNSVAVELEQGSALTIGGKGKLLVQGEGTERDIAMSCGMKNADGEKRETPASLKITDGTIVAQKGISVTGNSILKVSVQITGGSVDLKTLSKTDKQSIKITGSDNKEVHKVCVTLDKEDEQVEDLAVQCGGKDYAYGNTGIYTNADKKVFLYLPSGQVSVNVANVEYDGKVENTTSSEAEPNPELELTKAKAVITVGPTVIPALDYGYSMDEITAVPVTIKNTSVNAATVKSAQLISFKKDDVTVTTVPFTLTTPTDLSVPGKKENTGFTVKPKDNLTAGVYKAVVAVTMEGETEPVKADVSFTVNKVKVTPTAKINEKIYDGKRAAEGTVTLKGGVNGETPKVDESKVTYTFNNANVKEATTVNVKNLVLTDEWAKNYELTQTEFQVEGKIKKAPNTHTKADLKTPSVTTVYNSAKGVWQPQMTTYKGQEYLFFGSSHTSLTAKNKKSENWKFGNKATVKDRLVTIEGGLKSGATYTVWTRFAGDDNHEPSDGEVTAYVTFSAGQNSSGTDANGNKITGLVEGTTYKTGSRLAFGAVGAGMSNTSPKTGDERYLPISWKVSEEHSWSSAPYEAAFTINQTGSYTLQVTFRKQTYSNGSWTNTSTTSVSKVNFKMSSTGTNGTGYSTSSSTTTTTVGTSGTNKTPVTTAAKTGDNSPILPLVAIFLASAVVLAGYAWKKRSGTK